MMRLLTLSLVLLVAPQARALDPVDEASVLPAGQWELGLFSPLRVGLPKGLELRLHPITALVAPHAVLRLDAGKALGGKLVGELGLGVPTYGLRMLQGDAVGTFFPGDRLLPWMIVPRAGTVWSRGNAKRAYSLRADLTLGIPFESSNAMVESPGEGWLDLLFAPATDGYRARLGATYDRALGPKLRSRSSIDLYITGSSYNPLMVLVRQVVDLGLWKGKDGRAKRLSLGLALLNSDSHGPHGRSTDLMPVIDLVF